MYFIKNVAVGLVKPDIVASNLYLFRWFIPVCDSIYSNKFVWNFFLPHLLFQSMIALIRTINGFGEQGTYKWPMKWGWWPGQGHISISNSGYLLGFSSISLIGMTEMWVVGVGLHKWAGQMIPVLHEGGERGTWQNVLNMNDSWFFFQIRRAKRGNIDW